MKIGKINFARALVSPVGIDLRFGSCLDARERSDPVPRFGPGRRRQLWHRIRRDLFAICRTEKALVPARELFGMKAVAGDCFARCNGLQNTNNILDEI